MKFKSRGVTDRGLRRHHNEDELLARDDLALYVVADGMGGHAAGEVAADLAVKEVERVIEATQGSEEDTWPNEWDPRLSANANRLRQAVLSAHRKVTGAVEGDPELRGMGATIVAALLDGERERLSLAHVGDSRAYLFREAGDAADHVGPLVGSRAGRRRPALRGGGAQPPAQERRDPRARRSAGAGSRCRGPRPRRGRSRSCFARTASTRCSRDEEIGAVLAHGGDLTRLAYQLVAEANRKGGIDNITVIIAQALP